MNGQASTALSCEERIQRYNSKPGDLDGYDCPICNNKGNVMVIQDGYEYFPECECMERRKSKWRIEKSGLADMVGRYTFDSFEEKTQLQQRMKGMAKEFVKRGKGWFFVGGQVGAGKTHICTAICNEFMESGKSVRYMIWTDEVTKLKAIKMDEEEYAREVANWKRPEVLYIDDLFKTRNGAQPTDADVNIAFEIINARYNEKDLITIFSGERPMKEIMEIDEAFGSRIYQRCNGFAMSIQKNKDYNYRLKQK